jgi:hypothetical protein
MKRSYADSRDTEDRLTPLPRWSVAPSPQAAASVGQAPPADNTDNTGREGLRASEYHLTFSDVRTDTAQTQREKRDVEGEVASFQNIILSPNTDPAEAALSVRSLCSVLFVAAIGFSMLLILFSKFSLAHLSLVVFNRIIYLKF